MKSVFALIALTVLMSAQAFADPIHGNWRTATDDNGNSGIIKMAPCGAQICGTLVESFDSTGASVTSEHLGTRIITEMVNRGDGHYKGKIYSPDRDKTYTSKLVLSGNSLKVSGCVFGICRDGGTWKRQ